MRTAKYPLSAYPNVLSRNEMKQYFAGDDLPEVTVYSSYCKVYGISYGQWMSLFNGYDYYSSQAFNATEFISGGGGGSTNGGFWALVGAGLSMDCVGLNLTLANIFTYGAATAGAAASLLEKTTVLGGALAAGGIAAYNIYQSLANGLPVNNSDIIALGLSAGTLLIYFLADGPIWDLLMLLLNAGSIGSDLWGATHG